MSDRDKFEAWASDHFRVHKPNIDYFVPTAWEVWQASRRAALEEAATAIKAEDDRMAEEDYMLDSDDCIRVIRALSKDQTK